jgi:hypothetical protein
MAKTMNLYYLIWTDCIKNGIKNSQGGKSWKMLSLLFMSVAMTINFALIMLIVQKNFFPFIFYRINVNTNSENVNNIIEFVVLYFLPIIIINYLFIFYKHRYEKIIKKYPFYRGRLFVAYFLVSIFLPLLLLLIDYFL